MIHLTTKRYVPKANVPVADGIAMAQTLARRYALPLQTAPLYALQTIVYY